MTSEEKVMIATGVICLIFFLPITHFYAVSWHFNSWLLSVPATAFSSSAGIQGRLDTTGIVPTKFHNCVSQQYSTEAFFFNVIGIIFPNSVDGCSCIFNSTFKETGTKTKNWRIEELLQRRAV